MNRNFSLFLACLFAFSGLTTSTVWADWPNDIQGAADQILYADGSERFCEPIESDTDVDFVFLEIPPFTSASIRVTPDEGLDVAINFWRPGDTEPFFVRDLGYEGESEWEVLPNTTADTGRGYFVSFSKSSEQTTALPGPIEYCVEFYTSPIDPNNVDKVYDSPFVLFSNKEVYHVGEEFSVRAAYINGRNAEATLDIYLLMEFGGVFYWFPDWTEAYTPLALTMPAQQGGYILDSRTQQAPLLFTVPAILAGLGPFTFYTAASDQGTGYWSNVALAPVSFAP